MALFEAILECSYHEQQIINRWNYTAPDASLGIDSSEALAIVFGAVPNADETYPTDTPIGAIRAFVVNNYHFGSFFVRNVYDPLDFFEIAFLPGTVGLSIDSGLSPFVAAGFRTNRLRLDVRRGYKRIAGVGEAWMFEGGLFAEPAQVLLLEIANQMTLPLVYNHLGVTQTFSPTVVRKKKTVDSEGKVKYAYYPTLAEQMDHAAVGVAWQFYPEARTQNTRQYGRGS